MVFIIIISILANVLFTFFAAKKIEPIHTFFYPIAWYTFIVFISSVNSLRERQLGRWRSEFTIFNYKKFIQLAFVSVFVWLIFELFNLRIKNWIYCDVPPNILGLHLFGFLCFSTVLPGIFNIADFFEKSSRLQSKAVIVDIALLNKFFLLGCIFVVLLLLFPKLCFPLLWIFFIFLLEPLNFYLFKKTIIFTEMQKILPLLIAGFICGFLWEYWNFFSGAHWVYTLPSEFLMKLKLFQMPVLGYFGFPVFSIEAYQLYRFIENVISKVKFKVLLFALYIAFCIISFCLIINYSVISYK